MSVKRLAKASVIAAAMLVAAWLALQALPIPAADRTSSLTRLLLAVEPPLSPPLGASCRVRGAEAAAHARALEQLAEARWQRMPFALREGPRALLEMAEAEACYEAAGEREGRMRSGADKRSYEATLERSFARTRLSLYASLRTARFRTRADGLQRAPQAREQHQQVESLLALLAHAPAAAEPLRRELHALARTGELPDERRDGADSEESGP